MRSFPFIRPAVTGVYTNVPGAASPYTNAITGSQEFFRLMAINQEF